MTLVNKIKADAVIAMKNKEAEKLSTLRLLVAELEKEKVQHKLTEVTGLSNEQAEAVINRQIKKLDKEIEAYQAVNRSTEKQEAEKELLITYLPKQLAKEELINLIDELLSSTKESAMNIGTAMKLVSAQVKGKADMKLVNQLVRERL